MTARDKFGQPVGDWSDFDLDLLDILETVSSEGTDPDRPLMAYVADIKDLLAEGSGSQGLTDAELRAMDMTVDLVNVMCGEVIGRGPTREHDVREFVHTVHLIQQAILSQAAGRAHPDRFRLLGQVIDADRSARVSGGDPTDSYLPTTGEPS